MIIERFPEILRLSPSGKFLFVSELWNHLEAHPNDIPVSPEILAELDRRMEHFEKNPGDYTTWETVKERILGKKA